MHLTAHAHTNSLRNMEIFLNEMTNWENGTTIIKIARRREERPLVQRMLAIIYKNYFRFARHLHQPRDTTNHSDICSAGRQTE